MSQLSKLISELIDEELEEASTSANAGAYNVPGAFSDGSDKFKKRKKKRATTSTGYELVSEEIEAKDYKLLAQIIRMELASVFYDLYKKKSIWT